MSTKTYKMDRKMMGFCAALIIFVVLLNIILANDAAREAVIDFMLPVLEKFHHQPEMEIVSIETGPAGFL